MSFICDDLRRQVNSTNPFAGQEPNLLFLILRITPRQSDGGTHYKVCDTFTGQSDNTEIVSP